MFLKQNKIFKIVQSWPFWTTSIFRRRDLYEDVEYILTSKLTLLDFFSSLDISLLLKKLFL